MPNVIQRTANGIKSIPLDDLNFDHRIVTIRGEITQESAFELLPGVLAGVTRT